MSARARMQYLKAAILNMWMIGELVVGVEVVCDVLAMARHELIDTLFLHLGHFVMGDVCHDCQRSFLLAVVTVTTCSSTCTAAWYLQPECVRSYCGRWVHPVFESCLKACFKKN